MADELVPPGGWADGSHLRGALRSVDARPTGPLRALTAVARRFGRREVPQVFTALGRNPALFWPWLAFASRLMPYGKLAPTERELVILRTAWNCQSRYEWAQHVAVGLSVGLSDEAIVRIARGPGAAADPHERALLAMCDELTAVRRVSDPTWAHLRARYDDPTLVELLILAGHYQMLAGFLNTLGLPLEPQVAQTLQAFHSRIGGGREVKAREVKSEP